MNRGSTPAAIDAAIMIGTLPDGDAPTGEARRVPGALPHAGFGARFLRHPAGIPARQTGECWGDEQVVVRFAGSDYVCDGLSATQAAAVRARFATLCASHPAGDRPAVPIRIFRTATADFVDGDRVWEFDFELDYAPDAVRFAGFHFMGRLDLTPALRAALWTPEDDRLVSHAIFENVLRVVVAYHLLDRGGVLLHSAAVADGAGAFVFFGPSGAGKSTISRLGLASGRTVLSDDMNALAVIDGGVVVEKLPFAGELGQAGAATEGRCAARALFRLEKAEAPALRPLRPARATAALLECAPFVNRNPYRYDALVTTLQALAARLPVRVLAFAPERSVWDLLQAGGAS